MKNRTSKYRYGDKVRIVAGVKDPDFGNNIEGWTGEIDEIELLENGSWIYRFTLDKDTLSLLDESHIAKCEDAGLYYEHIYLNEKELELINTGVLIA